VLLAGGSEAITAGLRTVFGVPKIRVMSFFHVLHNLESRFKKLLQREAYRDLRHDIR